MHSFGRLGRKSNASSPLPEVRRLEMEDNKAEVIGAPEQAEMGGDQGGGGVGNEHFGGAGLTVQQTMRGCFQECCGCEAESEYKIGLYDAEFEEGGGGVGDNKIMYAKEESNCCFRTCCPSMRPLVWTVSQGSEKGGATIATYQKGWSLPLCWQITIPDYGTCQGPCCCCMPKATAYDSSGKDLGQSRYICDMCPLVPKFGYYQGGKMLYYLAPEHCCGGMCMVIKCGGQGGKSIYIPFWFRDPETKEKLPDGSGIAKLWPGMKKACCSDADNFALKWPQGSTIDQRKGLLGLNFLVDLVWFETHK